MASGNVTLLEAAKGGSNPIKSGVIEVIIQESPIVEMQNWMNFQGNALRHSVEGVLPAPAYRDVNEGYTRTWGSDVDHFWGVSIMGNEAFVDNYLVDVVGDLVSQKAKQAAKISKAMALQYDRTWLDGQALSKDFKGVRALIAEGFGQALKVGATGTGDTLTLDVLDQATDLLRIDVADAFLMNRTMRRKITNIGRIGTTGNSLIDVGSDVFGRKVVQYNGMPIRVLGNDHLDVPLLPFTESANGDFLNTNSCTSIYCVRFGEDFVTGLLGKGGSMDVKDFGETQAAPGHLLRAEWYPGVAVFSPFSIVRLHGITNS